MMGIREGRARRRRKGKEDEERVRGEDAVEGVLSTEQCEGGQR